jgi:uncharacterized protein (TIGR02147 family)
VIGGRPDLLSYLNYRAFLRDYFEYERARNPRLSLRALDARIVPALASSGLLSGVLNGKKNLGHDLRVKFAAGLKLKSREAQFFELLVLFNQTKDMKEKATYLGQLSRFRQSKARTFGEGQHLFFTRWYYAVIWNYFGINQKQKNPAAIAKAIHPLLTEAQVSEAIELLLRLGLIKKLSNGYAVTEHHLKTEPEFRGMEAMQYNQQFLELAVQALFSVEPERRLFNTMVFSISRATVDKLREKILSFQEEAQETINQDPGSECIYTLGFQLYPNLKSQ